MSLQRCVLGTATSPATDTGSVGRTATCYSWPFISRSTIPPPPGRRRSSSRSSRGYDRTDLSAQTRHPVDRSNCEGDADAVSVDAALGISAGSLFADGGVGRGGGPGPGRAPDRVYESRDALFYLLDDCRATVTSVDAAIPRCGRRGPGGWGGIAVLPRIGGGRGGVAQGSGRSRYSWRSLIDPWSTTNLAYTVSSRHDR